jgi:UDP-glucose 4-epimerase
MRKILLTGGLGLVGAGLDKILRAAGVSTEIFDIRGSRADKTFGDICDLDGLRSRLAGCDGIVHLAAVSRVLAGERDPATCWATNVEGTRNVLRAALELPAAQRPWVINASSREVYGHRGPRPTSEDSPIKPVNTYGRSKAAAETLTAEARAAGLVTAIARFSNVYGSVDDYPDRVVPAFARAAANGTNILIEGAAHTFDFTWNDDLCQGVYRLCQAVSSEARPMPAIHFASGRGTTLRELAEIARSAGRSDTRIELRSPRNFDVDHFCGDPSRADELLGWRQTTSLETGVQRLVDAFALQEKAMPAAAVA